MQISKVGVIGAGQMGAGIAQVAAQAGCDVLVIDAVRTAWDKALPKIRASLEKLAAKGALKESPDAVLGRLHFSERVGDLRAFAPGIVIEAIVENFEVKARLFRELDEVLPPECILASNTSSISITRLAPATRRPEKVIGMHFMNPVPLMQLVEVIRGLATDDATYAAVQALAAKLNKTTVLSKDMPGFIVNRILMPMINEAVFALNEGLASVEDIDTAMKLGTNQPMGPLQLADFIGLDTCLFILEVLFEGLGEDKYRPAPLLRQYVHAGWLGRKSKRGFYTYE
jgi:3-hydroxybutyryl-CoA dehydrogenase